MRICETYYVHNKLYQRVIDGLSNYWAFFSAAISNRFETDAYSLRMILWRRDINYVN